MSPNFPTFCACLESVRIAPSLQRIVHTFIHKSRAPKVSPSSVRATGHLQTCHPMFSGTFCCTHEAAHFAPSLLGNFYNTSFLSGNAACCGSRKIILQFYTNYFIYYHIFTATSNTSSVNTRIARSTCSSKC